MLHIGRSVGLYMATHRRALSPLSARRITHPLPFSTRTPHQERHSDEMRWVKKRRANGAIAISAQPIRLLLQLILDTSTWWGGTLITATKERDGVGRTLLLSIPHQREKERIIQFRASEREKGEEKREAITLSPADDSALPNHLRLLF